MAIRVQTNKREAQILVDFVFYYCLPPPYFLYKNQSSLDHSDIG